jgi:hypothetical protein
MRPTEARRSFMARLGAGASVFGAMFATGGSRAQAQPASSAWQPARHAQDDWLDQLSGKHRCFFDTTTTEALVDAILFAGNYYTVNKNAYGLENGELAVVIGLRHQSAPFAYSDAIWAKYGATLAERAKFTDPKSTQTPITNPHAPATSGSASGSRGGGLTTLIGRGAHISVCDLSTHGIAGMIAQKVGGKAESIYAELAANLIGNARLVPAGILAVNRAQERGYSLM